MRTLVDFHSHILPGMDDGSKSLEESIAMLRMEAEQGIQHVVATPHFYANHDTPERFLARREKAARLLRQELDRYPELPALHIGAEVHYFSGMSHSEILTQLTIAGNHYILIEMPQPPWTEGMYRELEAVWDRQGLTPILAHIDRYIRPLRTYGIPGRLSELPVLVQANAEFFLRRETAGMALRLLSQGMIHLLGSDCHNTDSRPPNLGSVLALIEKRLGTGALKRISANEKQVLEG